MASPNERLKELRLRAGLTVRALADALGMPFSTYAAYEDPKKFKKPILPIDLTKKIAVEFARHGISESETMALAGVTGNMTSGAKPGRYFVTVQGEVEAGVWRPQTDWASYEQYEIEVGPPPFPGAERYGARMRGYSMDKTIPPGSDLELLRVTFGFTEPAAGDLVVVARTRHDLIELTCKRLDKEDGQWVLRCESTKEEFQEPIWLGNADTNLVTDDGIEIVAIVLSSQQRHYRRR